jgi:gliding motility-associated lipoprotein GldH
MNVRSNSILALSIFILSTLLSSCDEARLIDENTSIPNQAWYYKNKLNFDVNITDTNKTYNVYVNLRVGSDYKYSNFFVMVHQTNPNLQTTKERKELTLLDDRGNWLGKGLGDIFDFQIPIYTQKRFNQKGVYKIELEQNMREDTLSPIYAAGIRVEDFSLAKAK